MRRMSIVMLLVAAVLLLSCSEPPTLVIERIIERVIEVTVEVAGQCPAPTPHVVEVTLPCSPIPRVIEVPREVVVEKIVVETVEVLVVVTATPTATTR